MVRFKRLKNDYSRTLLDDVFELFACHSCSSGKVKKFMSGNYTFDSLDTLRKTTPSTGRDGQLFQLISLLPGNTYELKELAGRAEGIVMLKVPIILAMTSQICNG